MVRTRRWSIILLIIIAAGAPGWTGAAEKTKVGVTFALAEQRFVDSFDAQVVRPRLERNAAKKLAGILGGLSFVSFTTEAGAPYQLEFRLAAQDPRAAGPRKAVGIRASLAGPDGGGPVYIPFRGPEDYFARIPGETELIEQVALAITDELAEKIGRQLLSHVPIAAEATIWRDPLGWILPYKEDEICMDRESVVVVRHAFPTPAGPVTREFRGKAIGVFTNATTAGDVDSVGRIFTRAEVPQQDIDWLQAPQGRAVEVKQVFVSEYRPIDTGCPIATVPPESVLAGFMLSPAMGEGGEVAQMTAVEAATLRKEGQWGAARKKLRAALARCPEGLAGLGCRLVNNYGLGYLEQEQGAADVRRRASRYEAAAGFYRRVLAEAPGHGATVDNMVLVCRAIGRTDEAEQVLMKAIDEDTEPAGRFATQLGDLRGQRRDWGAALDAYRVGLEKNPVAETPRRRIIETHAHLGPQRDSELMRWLERWEEESPEAARYGYASILARGGAGESLEEPLVRWVALLARRGILSPSSLGEIGSAGSSDAVKALSAYLEHPMAPPTGDSWWMKTPRRRDVIGQVALSLGAQWQSRAEADKAEGLWRAGLEIAPPYATYVQGVLRLSRCVRVDLERALAGLYSSRPALDPAGRKVSTVVNELFEGQGMRHELSDLEGIQRIHTTLGTIFAQKKAWGGRGDAHSAVFHLEHALDTAKKREKASGFHQPLADVKGLLVQAYKGARMEMEAAGMAFEAVLSYLDEDDLEKARDMLGFIKAQSAAPGLSSGRETTWLVNLVGLRKEAQASAAVPQAGGGGTSEGIDTDLPAWLEGNEPSTLPAEFLQRQRFKILADRATSRAGSHAGRGALSAFSLAVKNDLHLVGIADLLRLERVTARVSRSVGLSPPTMKPERGGPGSSIGAGQRLRLSLNGEARPRYVPVRDETVIAARIAEQVGTDTGISLSIWKGSVTLKDWGTVADGDRDGVLRALRRTRGVSKVRA
ncbi:MAG TPA: tetratricopeptide repeat protein [Candidatus Cryosericum sp.]|nr:tetratricopeptide repeat protein [Candidatus Cryosericum sp.]